MDESNVVTKSERGAWKKAISYTLPPAQWYSLAYDTMYHNIPLYYILVMRHSITCMVIPHTYTLPPININIPLSQSHILPFLHTLS